MTKSDIVANLFALGGLIGSTLWIVGTQMFIAILLIQNRLLICQPCLSSVAFFGQFVVSLPQDLFCSPGPTGFSSYFFLRLILKSRDFPLFCTFGKYRLTKIISLRAAGHTKKKNDNSVTDCDLKKYFFASTDR
jgi:hypothetical protein